MLHILRNNGDGEERSQLWK